MAKEVFIPALSTGNTDYYVQLLSMTSQFFNVTSGAYETYNPANIADYGADAGSSTPVNEMTEIGSTGMFTADVPGSLPAGVHRWIAREQAGAAPAESDKVVWEGFPFGWNGSEVVSVELDIDGKTFQEAQRYMAAAAAGEVSNAGSGTETFKGLDGATTRFISDNDANGNRTNIQYDP